ncbi:starvation-inducible DNA-binding protein [Mesocricetibacter intestinalis]|uniref:Starvation-inducible DNA-binding protein n=1 Tax=Mesocricetibacter intestinalis TaxID=1521930 RepID=A0A4V3D9G5_9PAST|nr:Dps family protein [Mesocricetibacter intestinalis]TDQ56619.1 starvation-inducible DNA-binding protein [Mesocricetibacter intestinalis]
MSVNNIGLDKVASENVAAELNKLLASYQVFYMNMRGYHWNIKGVHFFSLHEKFEEYYNDLVEKVDEIAERILTLGYTPAHAFSQYLQVSRIKEHVGASSAQDCLQGALEGFKTLLAQQREILAVAAEAEDEGSVSLLSDYISSQEKIIWMLSAACESCHQ